MRQNNYNKHAQLKRVLQRGRNRSTGKSLVLRTSEIPPVKCCHDSLSRRKSCSLMRPLLALGIAPYGSQIQSLKSPFFSASFSGYFWGHGPWWWWSRLLCLLSAPGKLGPQNSLYLNNFRAFCSYLWPSTLHNPMGTQQTSFSVILLPSTWKKTNLWSLSKTTFLSSLPLCCFGHVQLLGVPHGGFLFSWKCQVGTASDLSETLTKFLTATLLIRSVPPSYILFWDPSAGWREVKDDRQLYFPIPTQAGHCTPPLNSVCKQPCSLVHSLFTCQSSWYLTSSSSSIVARDLASPLEALARFTADTIISLCPHMVIPLFVSVSWSPLFVRISVRMNHSPS